MHTARESSIHFFAAGHHATECYGVQALGNHLAEKFGIAHQFIDIGNPAIPAYALEGIAFWLDTRRASKLALLLGDRAALLSPNDPSSLCIFYENDWTRCVFLYKYSMT